ncbi:MAG: type II toxin-antitoxin system HicB family antitoxin [Solirubrobacterales bacterium]
MAKVLISMPDALLERVDAYAKANGESRSGLLQRLAELELATTDGRRHEEFERLLDSLEIDLGGKSAAEVIREDRELH